MAVQCPRGTIVLSVRRLEGATSPSPRWRRSMGSIRTEFWGGARKTLAESQSSALDPSCSERPSECVGKKQDSYCTISYSEKNLQLCCRCCETHNAHALRAPKHEGRNSAAVVKHTTRTLSGPPSNSAACNRFSPGGCPHKGHPKRDTRFTPSTELHVPVQNPRLSCYTPMLYSCTPLGRYQ